MPAGTLIVEAAKTVGIEIPVFCYHHKLDPVGACRLCLVDFSPGPPRPQTACTTPVSEGMVVRTQSAMAVQARADILEFELANHPLDCPVCDKGGECPLQDFTFRHGYPTSRIDGPRLHFKKPIPLSDNIALDRERCVLCYRCTRYYDEVAWEQELTTDERGVQSFITSQFDQPLKSIFSGNIIDLCPVGALTSRVWRFESRPWDMTHSETICSRCSVGCSVTQWQRRGQLVRVTSHENDDIDEGWICDRGRFDYTDVNDPSRLRTPLVAGRKSTWADAINAVAAGIKGKGAKLGVSLPQDITNEEAFLFRRLLDGPLKGAKVKMHGRTAIRAPAVGVGRWDKLDAVDAILNWGPPPTAGLPRSVKFIAAWDHLPRDGYENAVVLPAATFAERQGTYTNVEGTVQFLRPPIAVQAPLKEGWEVLCELGAALGVTLDYPGIFPIQREIASRIPALASMAQAPSPDREPTPVLIGPAHP